MSCYPVAAYQQLFPEREAGRSAEIPPLDAAEDGDHYQAEPYFFEWWYFDIAFDDGSYLVAVFHSSLYNAVDHRPTLDIRYYPPQGAPVTTIGRFDRGAYDSESRRCAVRIDRCSAIDQGDRYQLVLDHGELEAELTFWPQLPGWKAGTGRLFADPASSRHFSWVVPLPRARVEGTLGVNGRRRQVAGSGYHDHNWGNVYLPAAFHSWTWGRVLGDDWTLIFGDVVGRGSPPAHVTPFLLAEGDQIVVATDRISITGADLFQEPETGRELFGKLYLSSSPEPRVRLTMKARRGMDALDFAAPHAVLAWHPLIRGLGEYAFYLSQKHAFSRQIASWVLGKGSYVRWTADCHLELPDHNIARAGQGLYEVMFL